jgi:osmoprotectant transport system ATP-binding protein
MAADPPLMLMDEPFGAVDPIARDRLQNEFLQIQARVRKTIIFVTHDVDEAIKMGDRIAVLDQGGRLAQFDTPERLLTVPASPFVASFVGADRAIKRLSLSRVRDLPLDAPDGTRSPEIAADMSARDALSLLLSSGSDRGLVISPADRRPLGTLSLDHIRGLFRQRAAEVEAAHG